MLDEVEPRLQKALPPGHYAFGTLASERSLIAQAQGDLPRALQLSQQALEIVQRAAQNGRAGGEFYLPLLLTRRASVESDMGDLPAAEQDARRALALLAQGAPPGDFSSFVGESRADEAADYAERAYRGAQRAGDQIVINQTLLRLARIYRRRGELPRATQMLDQVEPRLQKALPPGHYAFGTLASERSLIAQADGDLPRALQLSQQAVEIVQRAAQNGKAGAQFLPMFLTRRASIASDMGDLSAAEQDARRALALLAQGAPPGEVSSFVGEGYLVLARTLNAAGRGTEARSDAQLAAEHLRKALGPNHPDTRAAEALSAGHDPLRRADGTPVAQGTAAAAPIRPQAANSSVMRSGEALSL